MGRKSKKSSEVAIGLKIPCEAINPRQLVRNP